MKLFMTGGKDFVAKKPKPVVVKVKGFLDKSKDGELFTSVTLSAFLKINPGTLKHNDLYPEIMKYSHLVNRIRYWGKPNTIKQLIKETR
jgi:hypothetical protein